MTQNNSFIFACCLASCTFIGIIIIFGIPITEIVIGFNYYDKNTCDAFLDIGLWLIIKGFVALIVGSCVGIYFYYHDTVRNNLCTLCLIKIINLINLGWLIVGSILFFKYCLDLEPKELNIFMWISLILGYLSLLNSCHRGE